MKEEIVLTLHSSIRPSLKKNVLMKGSLLALCGVSLWLYGGVFLSIATLTNWGWPILILGGALVTWGLLPYRRLTLLENVPHKIIVTDVEELVFYMKDSPLLKIPLDDITEMAYLDNDKQYGIGIWLKKPVSKNFEVLQADLDIEKYLDNCQKKYFCDAFFPFFSKRSFQELKDVKESWL